MGRDMDVSQLGRVLAQAGEGAGSMVLVSGEAGIGKTRLCAELSRRHQRRGGRVLLGRAATQEITIPYAALADALRAARRAEPAVWAAARTRAGILWAVAPEFVRYAARRLADLALVLVVTYREEEIGPVHPWWPGLVQLKREPSVMSLPLARLSAADGERTSGPAAQSCRTARSLGSSSGVQGRHCWSRNWPASPHVGVTC
jgi:hypothetical protein